MRLYWKFAVVYLMTITLIGVVQIYAGLSSGVADAISVALVFLMVPIWVYWAGRGLK